MVLNNWDVIQRNFVATYAQLARTYHVNESLAASILDAVDNGDLEVAGTEIEQAGKILRDLPNKAFQIGTYGCQRVADRSQNSVAAVVAKRKSFYDALKTLEAGGYHLASSEQVVETPESHFQRTQSPSFNSASYRYDPVYESQLCCPDNDYRMIFKNNENQFVAIISARSSWTESSRLLLEAMRSPPDKVNIKDDSNTDSVCKLNSN